MCTLDNPVHATALHRHPAHDLTLAEMALIDLVRSARIGENFSVTIRRNNGRFVVMQNPGCVEQSGLGTGTCFDDAWHAAARV